MLDAMVLNHNADRLTSPHLSIGGVVDLQGLSVKGDND
jgi:hypothetical protein